MALGHMRADDEGVLNLKKIYLRQKGAVTLTENHFYAPMYQDLSEVLDLLKIRFEALYGRKLDYTRTFDGGMFGESEWIPASYAGFEVEEYFVFEVQNDTRTLLLRVAPVLLSHDKIIRHTIYTKDTTLIELITCYLGACARVNNARLVSINASRAKSDEF
ncbi:MAG: hypothetical protein JRF71_03600 [Deltaproteobacteria bacterium]|nr:hypothetical protein [Deltaproteobacteria bacterium]MBW2199904.1 hypothetical protein [Deltaproteobacteria bacterium]MBW2539322.1 hypothetical protein [Deltaproteobacteria bacterium]